MLLEFGPFLVVLDDETGESVWIAHADDEYVTLEMFATFLLSPKGDSCLGADCSDFPQADVCRCRCLIRVELSKLQNTRIFSEGAESVRDHRYPLSLRKLSRSSLARGHASVASHRRGRKGSKVGYPILCFPMDDTSRVRYGYTLGLRYYTLRLAGSFLNKPSGRLLGTRMCMWGQG